ncbi:glycosyltransferase [Priestia megaterium]|uniref:glycosyltransferase n=1 Tax=Priestia megaterium TaxID=1404 RepID=UPI0021D696EE|nr:glycosyltransferase [Priestia megaterium]MCU7765329.1 glycosyltransferase [Priestia megaterium]
MRNIKVLHIIPGYGGGISSYVKNLISGISRKDVQIDVVAFSDYDQSFKEIVSLSGGKTFTIPSIHSGFFRMFKAYRTILRENQYDAVHCHISGYKGLFFMIVAKIHRIPRIFVHAHRTSDERKKLFYHLQVKLSQLMTTCLATNYFTCSHMAAEFIFGKNIGNSDQVIKMPNSIDVHKFVKKLPQTTKLKYLEELNINNNTLKIGNVGRFNLQKNHKFMIKIIKELKTRQINFTWIFIGEGALEQEIKNEVKNLNLEEHVRFLGRREDVSNLFHIFDVFVLPSLFEGLPTVAIESQATGIPTLLADTITPEVDMEMGLVNYLPIQDNVKQWGDCILNYKHVIIPSDEKRIKNLEKNGFTLNRLGNRYEKIILSNR